MEQYETKNIEEDEIIEVRKRKTENGKLYGYTLVTKKYKENSNVRPFVHVDWLNNCGERLTPYVKMLKEYLEKHPEALVLILTIIFLQFPLFKDLSFLKSLLLKKIGS